MMPSSAGRVSTVVDNGMVTVRERSWHYYTAPPWDHGLLRRFEPANQAETAHLARNSSKKVKTPARTDGGLAGPGAGEPHPPETTSVAVPVTVALAGGLLFLLRLVDHERLGGEQHARDRGGVGHGVARHLHRVDDALGDEVAVLAGGGVVALAGVQAAHLGDDDV